MNYKSCFVSLAVLLSGCESIDNFLGEEKPQVPNAPQVQVPNAPQVQVPSADQMQSSFVPNNNIPAANIQNLPQGQGTAVPQFPQAGQSFTPITQAPPAKSSSTFVIYVGSTEPVQGFTPVQQGNTTVYVDPRQTIVYNDLQDALAVVDQFNRPHVKLQLNDEGARKLSRHSANNIGKFYIATMKQKLVAIFPIDQMISNGSIAIPMKSASAAQTLERRILDGD
ncbi:SecDF P1 head subdomain-containing protein [Taylorella equigenitalis]|uniref:SecDF P1 head subdomain domain-containing protein n=1 Tax=Taylorella equigenitalis ATCC 35865 TaxID=743973 RepID=A0ABN4AZQ3_9BURK|nr:hypothetical protein [Taylorella equigenitalis]AFN35920.1 hypothetical protein KUI_0846 [Taylorella equigenitalis ATCC 35865]ASY37861.1 hypothetical protein CA605_04030 [Taylorella equigenitalis]ASY39329.1 hypothetical protein CA604_04215 [Taylorella equigenitalis]ASY42282.1 hypothetical protein CA943_04040 [Taylorella equigenitalis]KGK32883.1 hypothetical protein LW90_07130 [Taylorella equigenitalis]